MKSAPLDLILKANGKKTGDELVQERIAAEKQSQKEFYARTGIYMNSRQRRALRKVLEKAEEQ